MMATTELEPWRGSAFFMAVGLAGGAATKALRTARPQGSRGTVQNARRAFALAQSVGWIEFPPG